MNACRWSWTFTAFISLAALGCGPSGPATAVDQHAPAQAASPAAIERPHTDPVATTHDLSVDEAAGGHTLQRHIAKSDANLLERLKREPQISSASTYTDRATAERVVGAALHTGSRAFASWRDRIGRRPNFVLHYRADRAIGRSIARGHSRSEPCDRAVIVLRWEERRQQYYVLTSYPEASR
jgi:Bacterial CdiA-CT RNAse A domain